MKRVTSIGEILFDVYPKGRTLGGAPFNFIYHIINLTGIGNFISRIGDDSYGNEIIEFLKKNKISVDYIQSDNLHKTGIAKTVLNDQKVPTFTIDLNTAYDYIEQTNDINLLINDNTDCLYFGTLAQRELQSRQTIQSLFNRNIKYFCDLNIRQNFYSDNVLEKSLRAANVLKVNIDELKVLNDFFIKDNFEINNSSGRLLSEFNIELLCVTMGEEGAILFTEDKRNKYKTKIDGIVDTVGAGDAYAALLCIGYLNEWNIEKINRIASRFAGEIIKIKGALPSENSFYNKFRTKIKNE